MKSLVGKALLLLAAGVCLAMERQAPPQRLEVLGAGAANYNGEYVLEEGLFATDCQRPVWRNIDDTYVIRLYWDRNSHYWTIGRGYGLYDIYYAPEDASHPDVPPTHGWQTFTSYHGEPAPTIRYPDNWDTTRWEEQLDKKLEEANHDDRQTCDEECLICKCDIKGPRCKFNCGNIHPHRCCPECAKGAVKHKFECPLCRGDLDPEIPIFVHRPMADTEARVVAAKVVGRSIETAPERSPRRS